jgi:hypothetical protein
MTSEENFFQMYFRREGRRVENPFPHVPDAPQAGPNYPALIEVLITLRNIPDGLGETVLNSAEAAKVRAAGFHARANCVWRCPPLPHDLVSWNPVLAHLSDAIVRNWDRQPGAGAWHPKRATARIVTEIYPLMRIEARLIAHLRRPPYRMQKRQLQQKMWRLPARFFNYMLDRLIAEDRITAHEGWLYPYNREEFAYVQRLSSGRRRA